jgi:hypothetical protein
MAAMNALIAAEQHGLGPQAAVQALVENGMNPQQAQSLVAEIVSRTAENTKGFEIPGIQNFLHGLTNQFTQLFSLPPGPPQDIAREAPFFGDIAAGKGNPAFSTEVAAGKGVAPSEGAIAAGKGTFGAPTTAIVSPNPNDLATQLGINDINVNDFGPSSPVTESPGPTETTFDVGPSTTQYDAGPLAQLSPVDNITPLAPVEMPMQQLDPAGPIELSPAAPTQAPSPASNPAISHAPPASQLSPTQAAQVLLAAGLPAQSLDAFSSAGLPPRRLLELLQSGRSPDPILDMVSRFAQPEEHAGGGAVDRYRNFPESENIEDRREWDESGSLPRRWNFRANWDPQGDFDQPARGLELALGRDSIPSRKQHRRYAE